MNVAKIILIALILIENGFVLAKHGEPKKGKYNYLSTLLQTILLIVLLHFAGSI